MIPDAEDFRYTYSTFVYFGPIGPLRPVLQSPYEDVSVSLFQDAVHSEVFWKNCPPPLLSKGFQYGPLIWTPVHPIFHHISNRGPQNRPHQNQKGTKPFDSIPITHLPESLCSPGSLPNTLKQRVSRFRIIAGAL